MNDLIDRQAAIYSMCELMRHWFGCNPKDEIKEIKRELDKLPAAQHNTDYSDGYADGYKQGTKDAQPEIIRCKDCKRYMYPHGCNRIDGMNTAQEDGYCSYAERRES